MIQQKHLQIFFPLIRHTRTHALSLSLSFSSFPHLFTWKRNDNRRVRPLDWLIERNGKKRHTHAGSDGEARDFWRRDSISSILHISRVFCYSWEVARSPNEGQDGATVVWRSKKRRTKRGKKATYLFWYKSRTSAIFRWVFEKLSNLKKTRRAFLPIWKKNKATRCSEMMARSFFSFKSIIDFGLIFCYM